MRVLAGIAVLFLFVFLFHSGAWSQNAECGPSNPGPGFTHSRHGSDTVDTFVLTKKVYSPDPDTDFDAAVKEEYGPNASVADWSGIVADLFTEKDAETFANSVGLERQAGDYGCHNYFVSRRRG